MAFTHFSLKRMLPGVFTAALYVLILSFASKTAMAGMLRITDDDAKRSILTKIAPTMPAVAKQVHLTGRVTVDMTVAEDGSVEKVDVISGNPVLSAAAVIACKKWTFRPFVNEGKADRALVRISFDFGL